jgi:hypothetical protein
MATGSEAKVSNLDVCRTVRSTGDKYVFRFQVTMDNIIQTVNVNQALENLSK